MSGRLTLSAEYLGRRLSSSAEFRNVVFRQGLFSQPFMFERGTTLLQLAALGGKVQIGDHWVATSHVLLPLTSAGLVPRAAVVLGLERVSSRPARAHVKKPLRNE